LLVLGHDTAHGLNSQVKNIFTGTPTDRAVYYYVGGAALTVYGILQLFWKGKS
jgi:hypothetical protein